MSLNGVWVLEVASVYGWERVSTAFLENGRYSGGNANYFSQGSYTKKSKDVTIKLDITRHGNKATIFGEKHDHFSVIFSGKKKKNKIKGMVHLQNAHSSIASYPTRFIRLADLKKNKYK